MGQGVVKYYDNLINLQKKYEGKQAKYPRKRERLSNVSTSASISKLTGVSGVGSSFTAIGMPLGVALTSFATVAAAVSSALKCCFKKHNKYIAKTVELLDKLSTSIGKFELLFNYEPRLHLTIENIKY